MIAVFAVLLLGVLTAIPALAAGSGTWTLTGSLNAYRVGHTAILLQNGQVLVAGGRDNGLNILSSAELYNPAALHDEEGTGRGRKRVRFHGWCRLWRLIWHSVLKRLNAKI